MALEADLENPREDDLEYITAYKKGSSLVIVAVNKNKSEISQGFNLTGISARGFNRYQTTKSANLAHDRFKVSGKSFKINLPESSITTLVSY